ncbi:unnamed protein product [Effrenium voratum]|nr:unnamed protein product [Effrenium voratum]
MGMARGRSEPICNNRRLLQPCFHYGFCRRVATFPPVLFVAFSGPWLSQFSIWLRPQGSFVGPLLSWTADSFLGLVTFPGTFLSLKGLPLVRHESTWQIPCQCFCVDCSCKLISA